MYFAISTNISLGKNLSHYCLLFKTSRPTYTAFRGIHKPLYYSARILPRSRVAAYHSMSTTNSHMIHCLGVGIKAPVVTPNNGVLEGEAARGREKGLEISWLLIDLLKEPADTCLSQFREKLAEREYAVISIGNGVRGNKDLTAAFEKLVNTAFEMQPKAKLGFAATPDDVVSACERVLGRM